MKLYTPHKSVAKQTRVAMPHGKFTSLKLPKTATKGFAFKKSKLPKMAKTKVSI